MAIENSTDFPPGQQTMTLFFLRIARLNSSTSGSSPGSIEVSPQQLEVGKILSTNLYLNLHLIFVPNDTSGLPTKINKDDGKILL